MMSLTGAIRDPSLRSRRPTLVVSLAFEGQAVSHRAHPVGRQGLVVAASDRG